MSSRTARSLFVLEEDTPLPGSCRLSFILLSPLILRVRSLMRLSICSSSIFSLLRGPRPSAYIIRDVWRCYWVPKIAISLLRKATIAFHGSLIVDVVGLLLNKCNPSASTSYNPSTFFFERCFHNFHVLSSLAPRVPIEVLVSTAR